MLYRLLVAALIAASASVTTAAPAVLDAGDALDARMAALEAKVNELDFVDKVEKLAEEHGVKEQLIGKIRELQFGGGFGNALQTSPTFAAMSAGGF